MTLGFNVGYIVGCCEAIEYICYVSTSVLSLGGMLATIFPSTANLQPLIWLIFYVVSIALYTTPSRIFWISICILAIASILFELIFIFGSIPYTDFGAYALDNKGNAALNFNGWIIGGADGLITNLPLPIWFFVGIESLAMTGRYVNDEKVNIPYGMITCLTALIIGALCSFFVYCTLPPQMGVPREANTVPYNVGYQLMFPNMSSQIATVFSIPAVMTFFSFSFISLIKSFHFPFIIINRLSQLHLDLYFPMVM